MFLTKKWSQCGKQGGKHLVSFIGGLLIEMWVGVVHCFGFLHKICGVFIFIQRYRHTFPFLSVFIFSFLANHEFFLSFCVPKFNTMIYLIADYLKRNVCRN